MLTLHILLIFDMLLIIMVMLLIFVKVCILMEMNLDSFILKVKTHRKKIKYSLDKFVWECFNDIIPKNGVIEHVDGDKLNNKLSNLRLAKYSVNCLRKG